VTLDGGHYALLGLALFVWAWGRVELWLALRGFRDERRQWIAERSELLNRIQRPEWLPPGSRERSRSRTWSDADEARAERESTAEAQRVRKSLGG